MTEVLILVASVYIGASIGWFDTNPVPLTNRFSQACAFAIVIAASMAALGMYQLEFREDFRYTLLRLMRALVLGFAAVVVVFHLMPGKSFGSSILALVMLIAMSGILLTRGIYYRWSNFRMQKNRIMVLGAGRLAKACSHLAERRSGFDRFQIVGFILMPNELCQVPHELILPFQNSLMSMVNRYQVDEIVVAVRNRRSEYFSIKELLNCKLTGVRVSDTETFFEREMGQVLMDSLQPSWMVFGEGFNQSKLRVSIKKFFDLLACVFLLIITLPIMLITALCIFLEDGLPILYKQERVGKDGHHFMVMKFRSMRNNAEASGTPQWATENDPRTTRVGAFIRKLRIDELPQIFNVLRGDMSFVGPRPERPYFVEQLCQSVPYYNVRHSIKPGVTGWAQVRYRYGASVEDAVQKLQYDLYYVKNNSLFLDLIILIDTVRVVLFREGGR